MTAHGRIALVAQQCTSCMICVRECPTWCITLDAHQEVAGDPGARRPRTVNVLDGFTIDWGLCMYCGICVEVCPFDALVWEADPVPPTRRADDLRHGLEQLAPDA
jgi:NADH-quinone oxidoreductase subunit I